MNDKLTEAEIEHIAERAANKAIEKVYSQIGKSVAQKIIWMIGVATVGVFMFISGKEVLK
jgi:preprotein translocase subunit SecF